MDLPNSIEFQLNDHYNKRTVSLQMTLDGESIDGYIDSFISFLKAVGFNDQVIKEYINED